MKLPGQMAKVKAERQPIQPPSDEAIANGVLAAAMGPKPGTVWRARSGNEPTAADRLTVVGCGLLMMTAEAAVVLDGGPQTQDGLPPGTQRVLMVVPLSRFIANYVPA